MLDATNWITNGGERKDRALHVYVSEGERVVRKLFSSYKDLSRLCEILTKS